MTREEFISEAKARGKSKEETQSKYEQLDSQGAFDDSASREVPTASEQTPYEKYGVAGSLFPATTKATERGGNFLSKAIAGAGDVVTLPIRAASAAATGIGTRFGGGTQTQADEASRNDLSKNTSDKSGALGFTQNLAYDPATYIPAGKILQGGKILAKAPTLLKATLRTGIQGAEQGGVSSAYQQAEKGNIDAGQTAAQIGLGLVTGAATTGLAGLVKKGAGKAAENFAKRNIDIELKPGPTGKKLGFLDDNLLKHDLIGTPQQTFDKSKVKLDALQARAQEIGKESTEKFKVSKMFDDVEKGLDPQDNPNNYAKQVAEIKNAKKNFIGAFGDDVDAPTAMKIRSRIGDETAFVGRISAGAKVDPDANWKEDVYNDLYMKFKNELHSKLGGELKAINTAQSEIIPIKIVAERRIPIAQQNNRISLADMMTGRIGQSMIGGGVGAGIGASVDPGDRAGGAVKGLVAGAALAGLRKAAGSAPVTKALYNVGKKLNPAEVVPKIEPGSPGTTAWDAKTELPDNAATPTYFRYNLAKKKRKL